MWAGCCAQPVGRRAGKQESRGNAWRYSGHVDRSPHAFPRFANGQNRLDRRRLQSFRFSQGLFDVWLPGIPWNKVPFVQPSLDVFLCEPASQLLNGRFIGTAMGRKDVERHFRCISSDALVTYLIC